MDGDASALLCMQPQVTFSHLPFEIRTAIYKISVPLSRVIRMSLECSERGIYHAEALSPPCVPTILHINHESRTIGLAIFRNTFGDAKNGIRDDEERRTYWNPAIDMLYLPDYNPFSRDTVRRINATYGTRAAFGPEVDDEDWESNSEAEAWNRGCKVGKDIYQRYNILPYVRHVALPVSYITFHPGTEEKDRDEVLNLSKWLETSFLELESVTILIDPYPEHKPGTEILLHELEGDLERWNRDFSFVKRALGAEWEEEEGEWVDGELVVEELMIGLKKTKRAPDFCVRRDKKVEVSRTAGPVKG